MEKRELPEGWEWRKIGDEAELIMGQSPPGSSYNENGEGIPFLQGNAEFGDFFPTHKKFTSQPSKIARKGSILISVRAPVGDINIANFDYCIGRGLASISLKNGENKYLFYLLKSLKPLIESKGTGSTFKAISKAIINEIEIPFPSLPVQRRIVEILEQADALRRLRAQADAETQRLLQSVFYEMFGDPVRNEKGWERRKLGDVCVKIQDGTHYSPKDQNGDIPYITAKNIRFSGIDLTNVTYIPKSIHDNIYSRCDPKRGDIIYIKDGVTAGLAKVNTLDFEFSMLSSIAMIRPDSQKLNPYYLEYYLNHPNIYKKIMERKSGSAITRLILREIREIPIILPPRSLQNEFAKIVLNAEQIVTIQAISRKEIDCLISGLMTKAFTGELN